MLLVAFDVEAVGALASVTASAGLLACALVLAPRASARTLAAFDWSLARGDGAAPLAATAAARSLAGNAMAGALPLLEAIALALGGRGCRARSALALPLGRALSLALARQALGARGGADRVMIRAMAGPNRSERPPPTRSPPRRRHHRRRPRRPDARAAAQAVVRRPRHPRPRAARPPGADRGAQGRRVDGRDRRQLPERGARPEAHLETEQLKKFGFRFFSSEGRRDIDAVTEIGASRYLSVPS